MFCSDIPVGFGSLLSTWNAISTNILIMTTNLLRKGGESDLAAAINQPDADPFDLLCYIVFSTPLRTRRERAISVHQQLQEMLYAA